MCFTCLSQETAFLFLNFRLVPHCDFQHVLSEVPPVHMRVHKRLVPRGLQTFLDRLRPSFAFITDKPGQKKHRFNLSYLSTPSYNLNIKKSYFYSTKPYKIPHSKSLQYRTALNIVIYNKR